jgi:hypothetical protein
MQDLCQKAEVCACKLRADQSPGIIGCERRVTKESWQIRITASSGGNKEVVSTSSVREWFSSSQLSLTTLREILYKLFST